MKAFRKLNPGIRFIIGVVSVICGIRCMVNATGDTAYLEGLHDRTNIEAQLIEN